LGHSVDR